MVLIFIGLMFFVIYQIQTILVGDSEGQVTVYQLRGLTAQNDNQVGGGGGGGCSDGRRKQRGRAWYPLDVSLRS